MPKVRRRGVPRALLEHLWLRIEEREISITDLELFATWLEREPDVPNAKWFKRFSAMTVCGEGEWFSFGPGKFPKVRKSSDQRHCAGNHLSVLAEFLTAAKQLHVGLGPPCNTLAILDRALSLALEHLSFPSAATLRSAASASASITKNPRATLCVFPRLKIAHLHGFFLLCCHINFLPR